MDGDNTTTTYKKGSGLLAIPLLHLLQLWVFVNAKVKWTVTPQGCHVVSNEELQRIFDTVRITVNEYGYLAIRFGRNKVVALHQLLWVAINKRVYSECREIQRVLECHPGGLAEENSLGIL